MDRRKFMTIGGMAAVGLAGCLGNESASSDIETETTVEGKTPHQEPTPTIDTPDEGSTPVYSSLRAGIRAIQPTIVEMGTSPSSLRIHTDDRQYVRVRISADGESPPRDAFYFRFDDTRYQPIDSSLDLYQSNQYAPDRREGQLFFSLPATGDASDAEVSWPGGSARPDSVQRRMLSTSAPPLSPTLEAPEELASGEDLTLTIEVRNDGSVPGWFVAGLNVTGLVAGIAPAARISTRVPPGDTILEEIDRGDFEQLRSAADDDELEVTYTLLWDGGEQSQTIRLN
jgi:hypothetical protein